MVLKFIDNFLNKITMYRLTLYCLTFLWLAGLVISFFDVLPFNPQDFIISFIAIFISCVLANKLLAFLLKAPANPESTYITSLILSLIAGPESSLKNLGLLCLVAAVAMASKYLLAIHKKHVFNPAAFAVAATGLTINYYPSWWIGDYHMAPLVIIAGLLIARKLQKMDLVLSFFAVYLITASGTQLSIENIIFSFKSLFDYSPFLFFAFVMLTEPATTPPTRKLRIAYGSLAAILLAPFIHLGQIYFSPELALAAANIFSYLVSPKAKLILYLKEKHKQGQSIFEFVFTPDRPLHFKPGQYLEWTLAHKPRDARGMRRYFTIASSPTEDDIKIGVKFYEKPSSYKRALESLNPRDTLVASQLAGEFTLPTDASKKLVFLAGGIGVTPFRSMIKYLSDKNESRDIIMFYANKNYNDIAYQDIFSEAHKKIGTKTVYVVNDVSGMPAGFAHEAGNVTQKMIQAYAPDFKERYFYISGPKAMIDSFMSILGQMGVPQKNIKTDFFPGFA